MKVILHFCAAITGYALGTVIFLSIVVFILGSPLKDWLGSTLGLFIERNPNNLDTATWDAALDMMRQGIITTPDSLMSNVVSLYGNMIQILVGVFALFGILSFFSIRWQSIQQAESFIEEKLTKTFTSEEFNKRLSDITSRAVDVQFEPLDERLNYLSDLDERLARLEVEIARNAPEDEPTDEERNGN